MVRKLLVNDPSESLVLVSSTLLDVFFSCMSVRRCAVLRRVVLRLMFPIGRVSLSMMSVFLRLNLMAYFDYDEALPKLAGLLSSISVDDDPN